MGYWPARIDKIVCTLCAAEHLDPRPSDLGSVATYGCEKCGERALVRIHGRPAPTMGEYMAMGALVVGINGAILFGVLGAVAGIALGCLLGYAQHRRGAPGT